MSQTPEEFYDGLIEEGYSHEEAKKLTWERVANKQYWNDVMDNI